MTSVDAFSNSVEEVEETVAERRAARREERAADRLDAQTAFHVTIEASESTRDRVLHLIEVARIVHESHRDALNAAMQQVNAITGEMAYGTQCGHDLTGATVALQEAVAVLEQKNRRARHSKDRLELIKAYFALLCQLNVFEQTRFNVRYNQTH